MELIKQQIMDGGKIENRTYCKQVIEANNNMENKGKTEDKYVTGQDCNNTLKIKLGNNSMNNRMMGTLLRTDF